MTDEERAREIAYNARVENLPQEELVRIIVALVQSERDRAVINERHACMIVAQDYADAGTCCGFKAMEIYHAIANRTLTEARTKS